MDTMEGLRRSQYCAEVSEADGGKKSFYAAGLNGAAIMAD